MIRASMLMQITYAVIFCLAAGPELPASEPPITDLAFSPDGEQLVAVSQSGLHVYCWPELEKQRTIPVTAGNLHCVSFAPSGDRLAVGGGDPAEVGIVDIFSWPAGDRLATLDGHDDSVRSIAWVDGSRILTSSIDHAIKLWDVENGGKLLQSYEGHSGSVDSICLLPDRQTLASTGFDQSVRVWRVETGELIRSLNQHTGPVYQLALRPAEGGLPMTASAASDRTIRFWQPTIGRMVRYVKLDSEPLDIAWMTDATYLVAACIDGKVRMVDADNVTVTHTLPAIEGWAYAVAVHPTDGSIAVAGTDGQLSRLVIH